MHFIMFSKSDYTCNVDTILDIL